MIEKIIEDAQVENLLFPGSKKETLDTVFAPHCSNDSYVMFKFLQNHISLESNGMGVGIRESKSAIANLLDKEGFDYLYMQNYVELFENKLFSQYHKEKEKEKEK